MEGKFVRAGVLVSAILIVFVIWQLWTTSEQHSTVAKVCSHLQPLAPSIAYKSEGQNFSASFLVFTGTRYKISSVNLVEKTSNVVCSASVDGGLPPKMVGSGEAFRIDAVCPGANKKEGDSYEMEISIEYLYFPRDKNVSCIEEGVIRGPVEQ